MKLTKESFVEWLAEVTAAFGLIGIAIGISCTLLLIKWLFFV